MDDLDDEIATMIQGKVKISAPVNANIKLFYLSRIETQIDMGKISAQEAVEEFNKVCENGIDED